MPGLDVYIEGESSTSATPAAQTDESGVATQLVKSTDMVSISSAIGAIQFDPISGLAATLYQLGVVDIAAWRVVEPAHLCRYLDAANQDSLAFYVNNMTSQTLEIPQRQGLNSLHVADNTLTQTQPPESFAPGISFFTVPLDEFRQNSAGGVCPSGSWKLLATERKFNCKEGEIEPDVPLCDARVELPCTPVEDQDVKATRDRMRQASRAIKKLEIEVKRRYPEINRNYSVTREMMQGMARIQALLSEIESIEASCSQQNPRCHQVPFPREALMKAFKRSFGPRPAKGRIYFRAVRKYHVTRFRKLLKQFPDYLVKCN